MIRPLKTANFIIDLPNVVVAGGSASALITGSDFNDIDIYFYGVEDLYKILKETIYYLNLQDEECERTPYYVNFCYMRIQILLFKFETVWDIINSFDLGSCQVAYDAKWIYTTDLFEYSWKTKTNIILKGYHNRICKYEARGFKSVWVMGKPRFEIKYNSYGLPTTMSMSELVPSFASSADEFRETGKVIFDGSVKWNNVLMSYNLKNMIEDKAVTYSYRYKYEWQKPFKQPNPYFKDSNYKPLWTPKKHKYYPELSLLGYVLMQIIPLDLVIRIFRLYTELGILLHLINDC